MKMAVFETQHGITIAIPPTKAGITRRIEDGKDVVYLFEAGLEYQTTEPWTLDHTFEEAVDILNDALNAGPNREKNE